VEPKKKLIKVIEDIDVGAILHSDSDVDITEDEFYVELEKKKKIREGKEGNQLSS